MVIFAVKTDATNEIERLGVHTAAASDTINDGIFTGLRLNFPTQAFNPEESIACSIGQYAGWKSTGLELKSRIDSMRKQVQNVDC